MKRLLVSLTAVLISGFCSEAFGSPSILDYYHRYIQLNKNKILTNETFFYDISLTSNGYETHSSADYEMPVTIDPENAFIEFDDEGTGGGHYQFQMTYFKKGNGQRIIMISTKEFDCAFWESRLFAYDNAWHDVLTQLELQIPLSDCFEPDFYQSHQKDIENFIHKRRLTELFLYYLPRYGTDIKVHFTLKFYITTYCGFENFNELSPGEQDLIRQIGNHIVREDFTLKWDKNKGIFSQK